MQAYTRRRLRAAHQAEDRKNSVRNNVRLPQRLKSKFVEIFYYSLCKHFQQTLILAFEPNSPAFLYVFLYADDFVQLR